MINIRIFRNKKGNIYSFEVKNHGDSIVCAAVSILTLNTVNSIEELTEEDFICDCDAQGYLMLEIPMIKDGGYHKDIDLLLKSFLLGVTGIKEEYGNEIRIID